MSGAAAGEKRIKWRHGKFKGVIRYARGGGGAAGGSGAEFFVLFCFFFRSGDRFMLPMRDFRSGKRAWLGSCQNEAKMSEGLDKTNYETLIHLVSQNNPPRCTLYQILICIFLESVLYDIVHPELVLSFSHLFLKR